MSEINLDDFPDLSEDYIEQQAEDLLRRYSSSTGSETRPPISAEVIAEQLLGYEIEITDEGLFSDPDYLGGIVFEDAVIKVNSSVEIIANCAHVSGSIFQSAINTEIVNRTISGHNNPIAALLDALQMTYPA